MNVGQSLLEKMAWWVVLLVLLMNIATFIKLTVDDNQKFKILKSNQDTLLCIVRESTNPAHTKVGIVNGEFKYTVDNSYIDKCVQENKL